MIQGSGNIKKIDGQHVTTKVVLHNGGRTWKIPIVVHGLCVSTLKNKESSKYCSAAATISVWAMAVGPNVNICSEQYTKVDEDNSRRLSK